MKKNFSFLKNLSVTLTFLVFLPLEVWGATVEIDEIAWMGSLPREGETSTKAASNEWIELKNTTAGSVNFSGWSLRAMDGTPEISLSGIIPASGYFLLERSGDDSVSGIDADIIYTGALSNSGEHLILKNSQGEVIDEIDASSGWPAGDNESKETMQRIDNIWTTLTPTPRAPNTNKTVVATTPVAATPVSADSSPSSAGASLVDDRRISAYAGRDQEAAAGSSVFFSGSATGLEGKPLDNARFWWNFGDGGSSEGRNVSHVYQFPGMYTVGLHVSSAGYAASDYLLLTVVPNLLKVVGVLYGEEGFIRFKNDSALDISLDGWKITDSGGATFNIPSRTQIAAGAEVAFVNELTGLLKKSASSFLTVTYPNGKEAIRWVSPDATAQGVEIRPVIIPQPLGIGKKLKDEKEPVENSGIPNSPESASVFNQNYSGRLFLVLAVVLSALASLIFFLAKKKFLF